MTLFVKRRLLAITIVVAIAAVVIGWDYSYRLGMRNTSLVSGWVFAILILFLAAYHIRKKLPMLPLGNASLWLQFHIYTGLLTGVFFLVHIGYRIPNGIFENMLTAAYLLVFLSGLTGLILSRTLTMRLALNEEHVIYDRIPKYIRLLREDVQKLILDCITKTESTSLPEFYQSHLASFFAGPKHFWWHLILPSRPYRLLALEMNAQQRYLCQIEQETMLDISEYVKLKHTLDSQYAHQATLKYWLFLHVPLTYVLIAFTAAHVWLVYRFSGVVS